MVFVFFVSVYGHITAVNICRMIKFYKQPILGQIPSAFYL